MPRQIALPLLAMTLLAATAMAQSPEMAHDHTMSHGDMADMEGMEGMDHTAGHGLM